MPTFGQGLATRFTFSISHKIKGDFFFAIKKPTVLCHIWNTLLRVLNYIKSDSLI
jgi:hypothetical protein